MSLWREIKRNQPQQNTARDGYEEDSKIRRFCGLKSHPATLGKSLTLRRKTGDGNREANAISALDHDVVALHAEE